MPRRWKCFCWCPILTLVADPRAEYWARNSLPVHPEKCAIPADIVAHTCVGVKDPVIDGFWDWRLSFNPGSAFGLFDSQNGARWFLSIVGLLAVAAMVWMVKKARDDQRLGDRLGHSRVARSTNHSDAAARRGDDFVLWHYHAKEWPVFNIADVALVIGVGMMFFDVNGDGKQAKADEGGEGWGRDPTGGRRRPRRVGDLTAQVKATSAGRRRSAGLDDQPRPRHACAMRSIWCVAMS
ncbi:MAG: signal peptidase II [Kofleriaceae bacterium]